MNPPPFLTEIKRRNLRRLAVAYVMAGLLLILAAAMLLALFEAAAGGAKAIGKTRVAGKNHPVVRRST